MKYFITILSFLIANTLLAQDKTIVVKKDITPEFTLNGKFKNDDFLSKSLFNNEIKVIIKNCDCTIISFEIICPTGNASVSIRKQTSDIISSDVLEMFKNINIGEVIVFHSILVKDLQNNEIRLPSTVYKIVP